MAAIKSYTDLEQSKKLAEILPIESADMIYILYRNGEKPQNGDENLSTVYESDEHKWYWIDIIDESWNMRIGEDIPCWSLAALLDILSKTAHSIDEDGSVDLGDYKNIEWSLCLSNTDVGLFTASNPVDACYKMIIKLHEIKML